MGDGPEIVSCTGCTIDWKAGKDVTATTVKVKTLSGKKGNSGVSPKKITKEVKADSFFNFFSPPAMKEDGELENDEDQATLAVDFEWDLPSRRRSSLAQSFTSPATSLAVTTMRTSKTARTRMMKMRIKMRRPVTE